MPRIHVVVSKESEEWLRSKARRKGDMGKLVDKAIKNLKEQEGTQG